MEQNVISKDKKKTLKEQDKKEKKHVFETITYLYSLHVMKDKD